MAPAGRRPGWLWGWEIGSERSRAGGGLDLRNEASRTIPQAPESAHLGPAQSARVHVSDGAGHAKRRPEPARSGRPKRERLPSAGRHPTANAECFAEDWRAASVSRTADTMRVELPRPRRRGSAALAACRGARVRSRATNRSRARFWRRTAICLLSAGLCPAWPKAIQSLNQLLRRQRAKTVEEPDA